MNETKIDEMPTTLEALVARLRTWWEAHGKLAEEVAAREVPDESAEDREERLRSAKYQEGKTHALCHALDLVEQLGRADYRLVPTAGAADLAAVVKLAETTRAATAGPRERAEKATQGPWEAQPVTWSPPKEDAGQIEPPLLDAAGDMSEADATFVAGARTDLPAICDRADALAAGVLALAAENSHLRAKLAPVQVAAQLLFRDLYGPNIVPAQDLVSRAAVATLDLHAPARRVKNGAEAEARVADVERLIAKANACRESGASGAG